MVSTIFYICISVLLREQHKTMAHWIQKKTKNKTLSSPPDTLFSALPTVDPESLLIQSFHIHSRSGLRFEDFIGVSLVHYKAPLFCTFIYQYSSLFNDWFDKGIHSFFDIFIDQVCPTFKQVCIKNCLPCGCAIFTL